MKKFLLFLMYTNSGLLFCLIGIIVWKLWTDYPCNHWGGDIRYGFILCGLNVIIGMIGLYYYGKTSGFIIAIGVGMVCGVFLFIVDYFNLLVEYNLWIQRGMPDMWQVRGKVK